MIYLDNNSTTKIDDRAMEAMLPYFTAYYGNAASNHAFGVEINQAVKKARMQVADLLGCDPNEIIFTSGATEAINLAIKGIAKSYFSKGKHIITVATEHPAVLDTCKSLEDEGFEVTYLGVNSDGLVSLSDLKQSLRTDTILVSVMYGNNETGVIQPIKEISKIVHQAGVFFMTDATQAAGKIPINVSEMGIDLLTLSAHKFYGPKGIGGLYCRSRQPNKVKIPALLHGGGHEKGLRSGTLNVPGIIGFGKASEIALGEMKKNEKNIRELRDYLESEFLSTGLAFLNGSKQNRLYNTSNICFKDADADAIIAGLENIMVSNGSACTSAKIEPSHVLKSMGLLDQEAYSSIRFSLSKFNSMKEIDITIIKISQIVENLRSMHV
jgi:cysteine desulfurase